MKKKHCGLIDMHCDTLSALQKSSGQETIRRNRLCVDLDGMKQAGTMVQFFACFVNADAYKESPAGIWNGAFQDVLRMTERMERETEREGYGELCIVGNGAEIREQSQKGGISAILTVEEGGVLNGSLHRLEELYKRGIRLVTLTWNHENCIGYPNSGKRAEMERRLKPFGLEAVKRMNELGMIVDVSHLSDGGFWDCIRYSKAPVAASHSNARALCAHRRNLTDDMLKALAETGGVAGLNFYPAFLRTDETQAELSDIARHAAHMIRTAGEDLPAIGTDLDGYQAAGSPGYISHVRDMERVWECMKRHGITERQLDKIWSENAMRVIDEVL